SSGSNNVAFGLFWPKFVFEIAPHSPFAIGLTRSQSGLKLPLASAHVLVTLSTERTTGLLRPPLAAPGGAAVDRFKLTLSAVLPSPNRSYAAAIRGSTSFHNGA